LKIAEKDIIKEMQKLKGVANVGLYGKTAPKVTIKADPDKLAAKGISAHALMGVLQGRSVSASIGEQTIDGQIGNVNVSAKIDSIETLKKLPLAQGITLQDIAAVEQKQDQESISRSNGKDVLFAVVTKESDANAVKVGNEVKDTIEQLNKKIKNVNIDVVYSTSDMVVTSVNSMMREVLMGALFATIVILLFLRNLRATLVTIISIPFSLAVTLYLLKISGITLNIVTLGGVAVAVGRLVDDSIVVIENIYRRLQKETFSLEMIINATKEVSRAITSSTVSTVAVFLPMGLLRGGLQAFLLPFALTVTYSLITSLIVALTVVPLLSSWLLRSTQMKEHEPSQRFSRFLLWNLRHKWVTLPLALIIFVGSIVAYNALPKAALDASDAGYVAVQLKYPNNMSVTEVINKGKQLEQDLIKQTQAARVLMQSGNSADGAKWGNVSSATQIDFTVEMKKNVNAQTFIDHVLAQKNSYPGAMLTSYKTGIFGGSSATEFVDIIGEDANALRTVAEKVAATMKTVDGIQNVNSNIDETKPVFAFQVDPTLANAQEITTQLGMMLNPMPIGEMELDGASKTKSTCLFAKPSLKLQLHGCVQSS
jgi:multidrug efflux pump subunit AcrB